MSHRTFAAALSIALLLIVSVSTHAAVGTCDTAGPVEVEQPAPTAYATLKAAFDAINAGTHTGALDVEICGNTDELAATATLNASGVGAALYTTISIKPVGGVARTITGATTAGFPLIDLNGADGVTIDGVNVGDSLTIANTTAAATSGTSTIRFVGGATGNTITRTAVQGSYNASATTTTNLGGTIFFALDTVALTGNDTNTISDCDLGPAGANLPTRAVFSSGSVTTAANNNSGLVINNNRIFDFFSATVGSAGVDLVAGTTDASITNNRLYQTASRTMTTTGLNHSPIRISNTSGNNHLVSGNTIGFATAGGTGSYGLVFPSTTTGSFIPINLSVGTTTATSVQGNTIAAIAVSGAASGTSSGAPFRGIYVSSGLTTIGNITGNTIGSQSATGSITYTSSSTSASDVIAMFNFGSSNWTVNNNLIGGITAANSSTGASNVYGVRYNTVAGAATTVQGNTIGGTVANSLESTSTATGSQVAGIFASTSASTVTSNTIRNLTAAGGTGVTTAASVVGIAFVSTGVNNTVTLNTIHTLTNTSGAAATTLTGIQYTSSSGTNLIARNFVHSFSAGSATAIQNGIQISGGTSTYQNNMIRLGINAAGASETVGYAINGINELLGGTNNIHFNSVYIGGSGVGGASNTFAFNSAATATRAYRDNIFFQNRGNGAGTGKHYAVQVAGTAPNPTGLTINYNVYLASGTGTVFGRFNALDVANLADWQTAVGQDTNSLSSNPRYLTPLGSAATVNLHINPAVPTVIEGNGLAIGSVTDDFDGDTRASFTPTDIGADAGNFMGNDLSPPVISYTPLPNSTNTTSRTLSTTITDASGVPTAGVGLPVIYFRKGTVGAYSNAQCSHTGGSGYDCVITFATVGGVVGDDIINYYVAAQDGAATPNVTTNPQGGASGFTANPPAASTPPSSPSSFVVSSTFTGTKTVCASGCDYTTLTGPTGIFFFINSGVLGGNLNIEVAGDLVVGEDGSVPLNSPVEDPPASNFTIKIYPTSVSRLITSTTAPTGGFIRLNAADRVTIDGSIGGVGSDRSLTITEANTGTATAVIWLQSNGADGATSNTIKNVNVVGNSNTTTLIGIGAGGTTVSASSLGTGNNGNTYHNNSVTRTLFGIYSQGASTANKNTGTVITQNSINAVSPNNVQRGGIHIGFDNGALISQNTIGNLQGASADSFGIALGLPGISNATFTGNEVTNATVSRNIIGPVINTTTFSAAGISLASATSGTTQISNNVIHSVGANGTSPDFGVGIYVGGGVGSTTQVYYNSVSLSGTFSSTSTTPQPHYGLAMGSGDPIVDAKNNALYSIVVYTGASPNVGQVYAIGTASTAFVNLTSDNNDLFTATGATYFVGRTGSLAAVAGTNHATLTAWQTATGDDGASISADPAFNSNTNLVPQLGSPLLGAGIPISVTIDVTGAARDGSAPTIGAYEDPADLTGPSIVYSPLGNTTSTSTRTLSPTISDPSGVPTSGVGLPVIYFRKGTSGVYSSTQCTHDTGNVYDCDIDYSLVTGGSVAPGDTIQYYVVAQDNIDLVSSSPSAGASGLTANPPAAGTPPTTPNSYLISTAVTGSYNVGTGETFTSLTNPGGIFQHINGNVLTGDVTIEITSDLTGETGTIPLNQWAEEGFSGGFSVKLKPSGAARAIAGTGTGTTVIKLNGADNVTIDGSTSGGTDRSLTINNPSTTTGATVIWIGSLGVGAGATNNTVKNCVIQNGTIGGSAVTNFGVFVGDTSGAANGADNDNLTLRNNHIRRTTIGIQALGLATTGLNNNLLIAENLIGDPVDADSINRTGMNVGQATGASITQNTVQNVRTSDAAVNSNNNARGILLSAGFVSSSVTRNSVTNVRYASTAGYGGKGIDIVTGNASSNLTIANNFVSEIKGDGWSSMDSDAIVGIRIVSPTGGVRLYHNSVNLGSGTFAGNTEPNQSAAFYAATGVTGLDVRNNIFATNLDNTATPSSGAHKTFAIATSATTAALYTTIDNNDYFPSGLESFVGRLNAIDRTTLADWQTATGQDANSIQANPVFTTSTNLHIDTIGGPSPVENEGVGLAAVTNDIDNDTRHATTPEIGADEVIACFAVVCSGFDTNCGLSSCDPAGLSGNCNILSPKDADTVCRASADLCDAVETCDGINTGACPADLVAAIDTECRGEAGDCDIAEVCDGVSAACPSDAFEPDTTECRMSAGPACDPAEFCTGSSAACPADEVDPNDAVGALTLDKTGGDAEISWTEVEPGPFNVYRGSKGPGEPFVYNHGCFLEDEAGPTATDTTTPPPHVAFYYLVSRVQPPCTESSLGESYDFDTNTTAEIPNSNACPDPGEDFDGDGVLDYLDNCPADPNAGQADADGDSHGDVCDNCPAASNVGQEDTDNDTIGDACE